MTIKFEYKIVVAYILLGGLWILFSDRLLLHFVGDANVLSRIQTFKGWFYVAFTGTLFFVFLKGHLKKLRSAQNELIQKNAELIKTKRKAEKSDKLKTIFIQNISHELRTPMNGIVGFAQILAGHSPSSKEREKYLKIIMDSSNQLLKIIDDIMEISKIETDTLNVNNQLFNLNLLMSKVFELFKLDARSKKLDFKLNNSGKNKSFEIFSDEQKIRQVLTNLLTNAFKYTTEGKVEFGYNCKGQEILFYVSDTGTGIEKKVRKKIFERFNRGEKSIYSSQRGTGLGLAICKGLLSKMGGKIWFDSEKGEGTTFYFTIPFNLI